MSDLDDFINYRRNERDRKTWSDAVNEHYNDSNEYFFSGSRSSKSRFNKDTGKSSFLEEWIEQMRNSRAHEYIRHDDEHPKVRMTAKEMSANKEIASKNRKHRLPRHWGTYIDFEDDCKTKSQSQRTPYLTKTIHIQDLDGWFEIERDLKNKYCFIPQNPNNIIKRFDYELRDWLNNKIVSGEIITYDISVVLLPHESSLGISGTATIKA